MVFRVFFFILLFMTNGTKEHLDEKNFRHCYGNFFESAILKVKWSQLNPFSEISRHIDWQQHFEKHPTVNDFMDMDQEKC